MSSFKIKVQTDNTGTSNDDQFTIPGKAGVTNNYTVTGSFTGSPLTITDVNDHIITFPGGIAEYELEFAENVSGGMPTIYFNKQKDYLKVTEISQWGTNKWESFDHSFYGCSNMDITASDYATADTSSVTNFDYAWRECTSLTSFPLIDTSSGSSFTHTWWGCSGLTSFPLIDTQSAESLQRTWYGCSGLTSFPLINTSECTDFSYSWYGCSGLTSFPLINTSLGTVFFAAWHSCSSLTSFPLIDTSSGYDFDYTWQNCTSLTTFPILDMSNMTTGVQCFYLCTLSTTSYTNILESLAANNVNSSVTFHGGNSTYFTVAVDDRAVLTSTRSWIITDGGIDPSSSSLSSESSESSFSSTSSTSSDSSYSSLSSESSVSSSSYSSNSSSSESSTSSSSLSSSSSSSSLSLIATNTIDDYIDEIITQIQTITQANGYSYDIGSINVFDNALSTFPAIDIEYEIDDSFAPYLSTFGFYEATIKIKIKWLLTSVADRPQKTITQYLNTVLNDIKGLFLLSDAGLTINTNKQGFFRYEDCEIVKSESRSVFTPSELLSTWKLTYQI